MHQGETITEPFLDVNVIVSVISEIELLGWNKLSQAEKVTLREMLDDCVIIGLLPETKEIAIDLKQRFKIKTPDAIIAATSKFLTCLL